MLFSSGVAYETCPGKKVVSGICDLIDLHRKTDATDVATLKEAIRMLYVMNVYVKYFDPELSKQSTTFFTQFAEARSSSSLKDYIHAVEKLLQKEHLRSQEFNLDSITEKQLMESAHAILIEKYSEKLLDSESLNKLLASNEVLSMKGLYDLLRLSRIQQKLKEPWGDYIQKAGAVIIGDKEHGDDMVLKLLLLRRKLDILIRDAFSKDETFLYAMRNAFARFMNDQKVAKCWSTGTSKVGEMNAKHIDILLRGGLKALPAELLSDVKDRAMAEKEGQASTADEDAELDRQLDSALELFRFLEGKDTFEAFYKRDLARRLLMGRSASADAERSMLTKLRSECGTTFTHNLEQMFKDQEIGKDEMMAYNEFGDNATRKAPLDLSVMVLSASAWPTYPDVPLNLPDEAASELERWEKYYTSKHTGRTVKWKHSLAHCSLEARYPKGTKVLMVSAFQAVVLLVFNNIKPDQPVTYDQISTATGLDGENLQRTLQSLACGKSRLITKSPKGREVNTTDTFTYNKTFTDPRYRVKINQIQHKETKEENRVTHERIAQDRKFETQAAIVRIMKSRKTLGHAELVAEVITMTKKRGSVEPAAIKKEIET